MSAIRICLVALLGSLAIGPCRSATTVSADELTSITNDLYAKDVNRAEGLVLNLQNRTRSGERADRARQPLFQRVPNDVLGRPTYVTLLALFNNYLAPVNATEQVTSQELNEENAFLDAVLATDVMKSAHRFLAAKGLADGNVSRFKQELRTIWFGIYSRAPGSQGSSGFEHVFLGEEKNGISGLHSWLRYRLEESAGNMNYLGYIKVLNVGRNLVMEMPMKWNGIYKPVTSMSIGQSPELDMALYTICFQARPDALCRVQGNGTAYAIQSHSWNYKGKRFIGSAYPTL